MKYSYYEFELIDQMYDEQFRYEDIAEACNRTFHEGKKVRTIQSISYAVKRIFEDDNVLDFDYWDERGLIE